MKKKGQRRGAEVLEDGAGSLQGGGRKSQRRGAEVSEEGWCGGAYCVGLKTNNDWDTDSNMLVLL